jgi:hypothetical protein
VIKTDRTLSISNIITVTNEQKRKNDRKGKQYYNKRTLTLLEAEAATAVSLTYGR